jgi:hypothetical protein
MVETLLSEPFYKIASNELFLFEDAMETSISHFFSVYNSVFSPMLMTYIQPVLLH